MSNIKLKIPTAVLMVPLIEALHSHEGVHL